MGIQFIGASIVAGAVATLVSFLWPKMTRHPRPEALTRVYDVAVKTSIGSQIESVLGEETINMSEVVSSAASTAVSSVTTSAKLSVIQKMFESLTHDEKTTFRAEICSPPVE